MRLSCVKGEDGYGHWLSVVGMEKPIHIYLDGKEVDKVTAFDDEAGWLRRLKTDEFGNVMLDDTGENVAVETLTGKVRATFGDA